MDACPSLDGTVCGHGHCVVANGTLPRCVCDGEYLAVPSYQTSIVPTCTVHARTFRFIVEIVATTSVMSLSFLVLILPFRLKYYKSKTSSTLLRTLPGFIAHGFALSGMLLFWQDPEANGYWNNAGISATFAVIWFYCFSGFVLTTIAKLKKYLTKCFRASNLEDSKEAKRLKLFNKVSAALFWLNGTSCVICLIMPHVEMRHRIILGWWFHLCGVILTVILLLAVVLVFTPSVKRMESMLAIGNELPRVASARSSSWGGAVAPVSSHYDTVSRAQSLANTNYRKQMESIRRQIQTCKRLRDTTFFAAALACAFDFIAVISDTGFRLQNQLILVVSTSLSISLFFNCLTTFFFSVGSSSLCL